MTSRSVFLVLQIHDWEKKVITEDEQKEGIITFEVAFRVARDTVTSQSERKHVIIIVMKF